MNIELLSTFQQNHPEEFDGTLDCASMAVCCAFNKIGTFSMFEGTSGSTLLPSFRIDVGRRLFGWTLSHLGFSHSRHREDHLCRLVADLFDFLVEEVGSDRHIVDRQHRVHLVHLDRSMPNAYLVYSVADLENSISSSRFVVFIDLSDETCAGDHR